MSYEDTIRVADLKTRSSRVARFRGEVRAAPGQIVHVSEFMHPRFQEFCETMPATLGLWLSRSTTAARVSAPLFRRGRQVSTGKIGGFIALYLLAGLRRWRRGYAALSSRASAYRRVACADTRKRRHAYDLAVEIAECQRLVKGYGDTHERGLANFERIMQFIDRAAGRAGLAAQVRRLRSAALADEDGREFDTALEELAAV